MPILVGVSLSVRLTQADKDQGTDSRAYKWDSANVPKKAAYFCCRF
jgi:hypothetical protein